MTWTLHSLDRFPAMAETWDRLQAATTCTPFLAHAYLQPLIDEFASGDERIAFREVGGSVTAATIVQPSGRGMWQVFQPSQLPLAAWIAARDSDTVALARSLIAALPGLALGLGLPQLDPKLLVRPADGPHGRTQDYIDTSWIDVATPFDAYWEARGKNLRQNVRKQRNKLKTDDVSVQFDCVRDPDAVAAAIAEYGALEAAGWKASIGTAVRLDNAQGRFYRGMLENFCRLGRGRIYRLRFDGKVVAMDLCIDDGAIVVVLKTTYDESYTSISPSTLMRHDAFADLFGEGRFQRIEFYGKTMEWHRRWTETERTLYHLTVYRWPLLRSLHDRARRLRRPDAAEPAAVPGAASAPASVAASVAAPLPASVPAPVPTLAPDESTHG